MPARPAAAHETATSVPHMPEIDAERLLATYPRTRPPLPRELAERFVEEYRANRNGQHAVNSLVARLESWMHRRIAANAPAGSILEIGAGTLNHVPYEEHATRYDVVEPFEELWIDSVHRPRVQKILRDIDEVDPATRYDRIVSVAVLEHLTDLPRVVAKCATRLSPGGRFQAGIPSEGGLAWWLGWNVVTGPAFRFRTGLPYGALMRHEHVNNAAEIECVVHYLFERVNVQRFPLPFVHGSFYTYLDASEPRLDRAAGLARPQATLEPVGSR